MDKNEENSEEDTACEEDEYDVDDPMQAIYATKSKRPSPKPNKSSQYIAKEHFDPLPEHVKETIKQQHESYWELLRQAQFTGAKGGTPSPQGSLHITRVHPDESYSPEDPGKGIEEVDEIPKEEVTNNYDPVLNTFNQFLQRARKKNE